MLALSCVAFIGKLGLMHCCPCVWLDRVQDPTLALDVPDAAVANQEAEPGTRSGHKKG